MRQDKNPEDTSARALAQVEVIASPKSLVTTMEAFRPDVVLLDMNFYTDIYTGNEGLYWTGELKKMWPDVQLVLFTAYADIALAAEGMKQYPLLEIILIVVLTIVLIRATSCVFR